MPAEVRSSTTVTWLGRPQWHIKCKDCGLPSKEEHWSYGYSKFGQAQVVASQHNQLVHTTPHTKSALKR